MAFDFNPRSPCGERLCRQTVAERDAKNFNPRSPCGERPHQFAFVGVISVISIHAPRVGSDWDSNKPVFYEKNFNPRSPCGERQGGTDG